MRSTSFAHAGALRGVRTNIATWLAAAFLALTSVAAGAQEKGGSMTYLSSNIPGLNPLHSAFEVGLVSSQIFASLVRLGEDNRPIPYLAESFSVSDDGLAYTFNLAKNATFHDGKPVTAADVAFSLGVVQKHHRFGPQMFGPVEKVETPTTTPSSSASRSATVRCSWPRRPRVSSRSCPSTSTATATS